MKRVLDTVLSQYANSPALMQLINGFNAAVDPAENIDAFYEKVWNISTAEGYGLDVWGRIVGVSRSIHITDPTDTFGFKEALPSSDPFGFGPFFTGIPPQQFTTAYLLSDDAYRVLILVKALFNISRATISVYNQFLTVLFAGRGKAYVSDTGYMNMRLNFEFLLTPVEIAILKQSGAFSPPTGVLYDIMDIQLNGSFGFAEMGAPYAAGFNNGTLFKGFE